jgi:hypothetical protein
MERPEDVGVAAEQSGHKDSEQQDDERQDDEQRDHTASFVGCE